MRHPPILPLHRAVDGDLFHVLQHLAAETHNAVEGGERGGMLGLLNGGPQRAGLTKRLPARAEAKS